MVAVGWVKRMLTEEGVKKAKEEIDSITKLNSRLAVKISSLEPDLRRIAEFVQKKEHFEHKRTVYLMLLTMRADLLQEHERTVNELKILLDRARMNWPGASQVKDNIAKLKEKDKYIEFLLGYIKQVLARELEPGELAQRLLELDSEITNFGGARLLTAIENALKKDALMRGDIVGLSRSLKKQ
ncbi:MAG: hypothetical protein QXH80_00195 [Candidatus Nanoarchaeia archaeon]